MKSCRTKSIHWCLFDPHHHGFSLWMGPRRCRIGLRQKPESDKHICRPTGSGFREQGR
jgi:hypothetical protein